MNEISLVPTDALTKRLLVDLLTKMFKQVMATKITASSEFTKPDVTTDTHSSKASEQSDANSN